MSNSTAQPENFNIGEAPPIQQYLPAEEYVRRQNVHDK